MEWYDLSVAFRDAIYALSTTLFDTNWILNTNYRISESEIAQMAKDINLKIADLESEYYRLRYHQLTVRPLKTFFTSY